MNVNKHGLVEIAQDFARMKFILMKKPLSLNEIAEHMEVPKRRLYDVVNVLQSMNMIERVGRTAIKWIPTSTDAQESEQLQEEVNDLAKQEKDIESLLKNLRECIELEREDPENQLYNYIKKSDIRDSIAKDTRQFVFRSSANTLKNMSFGWKSTLLKVNCCQEEELITYCFMGNEDLETSSYVDIETIKHEKRDGEEQIDIMHDPMIAANEGTVIDEDVRCEEQTVEKQEDDEEMEQFYATEDEVDVEKSPSYYRESLSPSSEFDSPFVQSIGDYFSFKQQTTPPVSPSSQLTNSNNNTNNNNKIMPTAALASVARVLRLSADTMEEAAEAAAAVLLKGGIVALPTDTLYGISTLIPYSDRLYALKKRPHEKPLGIFLPSASSVHLVAKQTISDELANRLLPGPVTLVFERLSVLPADFNPNVNNVGVRVPDAPIVSEICRLVGQPLAQTSANVSGSPFNPTKLEDFEELIQFIDLVLDGGPIVSKSCEGSTIVDLSKPGRFEMIRDGCAKKRTEEILREFGLDG